MSYDTTYSAESISTSDVVDADSLVVGIPYHNERYRVEIEGGTEILLLQPQDERLVTRGTHNEKVDWTGEFVDESSSAADTEVPFGRSHVLGGEPIDVVYTWVDSAERDWRTARSEFRRPRLFAEFIEERTDLFERRLANGTVGSQLRPANPVVDAALFERFFEYRQHG